MRVALAPLTTQLAAIEAAERRRSVGFIIAAIVLIVAGAAVALSLGDANLPLSDLVPTLVGNGTDSQELVLYRLRGPRVAADIICGVAFAVAGALFQSTLRNDLASPDILGISNGASLGAVWALLGLGWVGFSVSVAAFTSALVAAILIWALAWRNGLHGIRFVLVGVGVAYLSSSLLAWFLARAEVRQAQRALFWTVGSTSDVRDRTLLILVALIACALPVVVLMARIQLPLALGEDLAAGLGVRVHRARMVALLAAVWLVAAATAAAGPIPFVAATVPTITPPQNQRRRRLRLKQRPRPAKRLKQRHPPTRRLKRRRRPVIRRPRPAKRPPRALRWRRASSPLPSSMRSERPKSPPPPSGW